MSEQLVSVILPCYNESENIIQLIDSIHSSISDWKHEIIVVDDNSPDGTYELVQGKNYDFVRAIKRESHPSLAKSIRCGIEYSLGEDIVIMDSDFNHQPSELPVMLTNLQFYDCVLGSRFVYGGKMENRFRHLCSWLFNIFVRILTRKFITDSLYGFIAIKRVKLYDVNFDEIFWGFGDYGIRLMYYLQRNKISILQVPSVLGKRLGGQGNSAFIRTLMAYTKSTFELVIKNMRPRKNVSPN